MKKIVLTGGGTAGHVTPNIALLKRLKEEGYEISYIGSKDGIEKRLIADFDIPYYSISTGKLRRYLSLKNLSDPFRVIAGYNQAKKLLKELQPDVIFSKGGFVSVPVIRAAKGLKIPSIIHESDMTPGLANKLSIPCVEKICVNFPETLEKVPENKGVLTGTPIREELFQGVKEKGLEFCGFNDKKPVIMIIGGSLGAQHVNDQIREILPQLLEEYQIVHLCGKGKLDESLVGTEGYVQFEYIKAELKDLFAAADIVISRAGANAICELLALRKPMLLVPLSAAASRGDQILNAHSFENQGYASVLEEEDMNDESMFVKINKLYADRERYIENMKNSKMGDSVDTIISLINEAASK
ncbi:MAG: undecaprenyldiphospho-muramoylpentapeptide beta-N-acetylglucosaminyltransferase [Lachnospiraceae bacterium]|nr:undecaprenyldiphospho-muramoylpentapeptide beta-N-acetylglucosaminyltransferase [Lachnospiraceae bacterium]